MLRRRLVPVVAKIAVVASLVAGAGIAREAAADRRSLVASVEVDLVDEEDAQREWTGWIDDSIVGRVDDGIAVKGLPGKTTGATVVIDREIVHPNRRYELVGSVTSDSLAGGGFGKIVPFNGKFVAAEPLDIAVAPKSENQWRIRGVFTTPAATRGLSIGIGFSEQTSWVITDLQLRDVSDGPAPPPATAPASSSSTSSSSTPSSSTSTPTTSTLADTPTTTRRGSRRTTTTSTVAPTTVEASTTSTSTTTTTTVPQLDPRSVSAPRADLTRTGATWATWFGDARVRSRNGVVSVSARKSPDSAAVLLLRPPDLQELHRYQLRSRINGIIAGKVIPYARVVFFSAKGEVLRDEAMLINDQRGTSALLGWDGVVPVGTAVAAIGVSVRGVSNWRLEKPTLANVTTQSELAVISALGRAESARALPPAPLPKPSETGPSVLLVQGNATWRAWFGRQVVQSSPAGVKVAPQQAFTGIQATVGAPLVKSEELQQFSTEIATVSANSFQGFIQFMNSKGRVNSEVPLVLTKLPTGNLVLSWTGFTPTVATSAIVSVTSSDGQAWVLLRAAWKTTRTDLEARRRALASTTTTTSTLPVASSTNVPPTGPNSSASVVATTTPKAIGTTSATRSTSTPGATRATTIPSTSTVSTSTVSTPTVATTVPAPSTTTTPTTTLAPTTLPPTTPPPEATTLPTTSPEPTAPPPVETLPTSVPS